MSHSEESIQYSLSYEQHYELEGLARAGESLYLLIKLGFYNEITNTGISEWKSYTIDLIEQILPQDDFKTQLLSKFSRINDSQQRELILECALELKKIAEAQP